MKAILCRGAGGPEVLFLGDVSDVHAKKGEVRIQVKASGLNRADLIQRRGYYPPPPGESEILGLEVAGVIDEAPEGSRLRVGDLVMALIAGGGYASLVAAPEFLVMKKPEGLDFVQAAAIPEAFLTAHHNVFHLGGASKESHVLVHAGASGVGTAAIQMIVASGGKTSVTVGSEEKADVCRKLGAEVIQYKKENFADILASSVDVILDPVGGQYLEGNLRALKEKGRLVVIGTLSGKTGSLNLSELLSRRLSILGSVLRPLPLIEKAAIVERFSKDFLSGFSGEKPSLKPIVDSIFPVGKVAEAHLRMEGNLNIGKIILMW